MNDRTPLSHATRGGSILMELVISMALFIVMLGIIMWLGDLVLVKCKLVTADRYAAWNAGNRHTKTKGYIKADIISCLFPSNRVGNQTVRDVRYERPPTPTDHGTYANLDVVTPMAANFVDEETGEQRLYMETSYYGTRGDLWAYPYGAWVEVEMDMPQWTRAWLEASMFWTAALGTNVALPPGEGVAISGRDPEEPTLTSRSVVMMRTPFGSQAYRTWDPDQLAGDLFNFMCRPWRWDVRYENWPDIEEMQPITEEQLAKVDKPPMPPVVFTYDRFAQYEDWSE